ncbi:MULTISPECIES: glycerol-3-phosphate ABC transporter substrate-binding protein [Calothrix]|uniref:Glycerol-3-phosphate ABC transporter substrate-binding protein n=2 Tax=Calothrix TaxID=1186 RepID=A0ABR8AM40_9CYAN|nr:MULTISPECIES: glycerol-3-phosphate ABC transporter substrate-binding protein [Calothrix]MBD2200859.1 glycerol-3-phosphate ABC transporter substrate-binding protein [Calothrix parietina FACHB-288]MBD2229892.1 glycerol-3-phosphate ABC transporter substrate-binding protein [Calothrix anomala FACHB-343]
MLTTYEPSIFDSLNKFSDAKQSLAQHKNTLGELGAVICKHGLQQKIGLTLLHKHFDLLPHERLIESVGDNKIYINPIAGVDEEAIIPYLWKFSSEFSGENLAQNISYSPLEFQYKSTATTDNIEAVQALMANSNFLEEIAMKLQNFGLEDVFGLSILHREAIAIAKGEILVETTDHEKRCLTLTAVNSNDVCKEELTETLWHFTEEDLGFARVCLSHCISHCTSH